MRKDSRHRTPRPLPAGWSVAKGDLFERPVHWGTWRARAPYAVVDLETTGFGYSDSIVEISIVTLNSRGRVRDDFTTLVNPEHPMGASHVHGISASQVTTAPTFGEIADEILARLGGAVVVAHNLNFEERMLATQLRRYGVRSPRLLGLCTAELGKRALGGTQASLSHVAAAYGVVPEQAHHAYADVMTVCEFLPMLLQDVDVRFAHAPS